MVISGKPFIMNAAYKAQGFNVVLKTKPADARGLGSNVGSNLSDPE